MHTHVEWSEHWKVQGLDISAAMLDVALDREVEGDLCLHDMGHGLPLRAGIFDGAISISAIQWLCNAVSLSPSFVPNLCPCSAVDQP